MGPDGNFRDRCSRLEHPRFDPAKPGREMPAWVTRAADSPTARWIIAILALLFAVWVLAAAIWAPTEATTLCPARSMSYFGSGWLPLGLRGPGLATVVAVAHRLSHMRHCSAEGTRWPRAAPVRRDWGYWPAVSGFSPSSGLSWLALTQVPRLPSKLGY